MDPDPSDTESGWQLWLWRHNSIRNYGSTNNVLYSSPSNGIAKSTGQGQTMNNVRASIDSVTEGIYRINTTKQGDESVIQNTSCLICYESFGDVWSETDMDVEADMRVTVEDCGHVFCRPCLVTLIQHDVRAKTVPSSCPGQDCKQILSTELLHILLGDNEDDDGGSLLARYDRLQQMMEDPSLEECVRCNGVFSTRFGVDDLTCTECGHSFCRAHGDIHPNRTCAAYKLKMDSRQIWQTQRVLARLTKPCPNCGVRLQKSGGCDHFRCRSCNHFMCWNCMKPFAYGQPHSCSRNCWGFVNQQACRAACRAMGNIAVWPIGIVMYILYFSVLLLAVVAQIAWVPLALGAFVLIKCFAFGAKLFNGTNLIMVVDWAQTVFFFFNFFSWMERDNNALRVVLALFWTPLGIVLAPICGLISWFEGYDWENTGELMKELLLLTFCLDAIPNLSAFVDRWLTGSSSVEIPVMPIVDVESG